MPKVHSSTLLAVIWPEQAFSDSLISASTGSRAPTFRPRHPSHWTRSRWATPWCTWPPARRTWPTGGRL